MNYKLLILPLLLFLSINCLSQETKVFVLDMAEPHRASFSQEKYEKDTINSKIDTIADIFGKLQLQHDQLVALKLINANPFKYNYVVNNEVVDFFVEEQGTFLEVVEKAKTPKKASPKANATNASNSNSTPLIPTEITSFKSLIKETENKIDTLQARVDKKLEEVKSLKSINQELKSDNANSISRANLNVEAEVLIKENSSLIDALDKEIVVLNNRIKDENKNLDNNRKRKRRLQDQLDRMIKEQNKAKKEDRARREEQDIQIYKTAVILVRSNSYSVQQLVNSIKLYQAKIEVEDFLDIQGFKTKREELSKNLDSIRNVMNSHTLDISGKLSEERTKSYNSLLLGSFGKELKTAQALLDVMFSVKTKNYSLPMAVDGKNIDVVKLKVERIPKNDKNLKSDSHTYDIWVKGGLKIDVSAGLFYSSLVDREYGRRDVKMETTNEMGEMVETTKQAIYEKNPGEYQYGFGSMLNVYYRNGKWVNPRVLSVGAALTNNQKFQFLAGGGLILGKQQRVILNVGITLGSVTKLLDTYKADNEKLYEFSSDDAIPTVEKFSVGHFFSLTYNLGKTKTQKPSTD